MPAPSTVSEFVDLVRKSTVVEDKKLDVYVEKLRSAKTLPAKPTELAGLMIRDGLLTQFQAEQFLLGKWRRFTIGKYKVLERLGSGGMGSVYLCEHKLMRRRVAVKVLPTAKAEDESSLQRFYREARAVAALDHPNIVRAYDIDQDDKLHFLVMEYVDGASLQEIIKRTGPMEIARACHYMRQSAMGLQHAHEAAGLVHRDVKPGNILVDRTGTVKVLDMGLARFFNDEEDNITKKYDENVLGTADYLAPEQALNSHDVDIRADIYSLGATFYFCLTGKTPFSEGSIAQKLIWHQTRQPKSIKTVRQDVPDALVSIIDKMMAKEPGQRYQTPGAVADALEPFTQETISPPPDVEMPRLSPAAMGPASLAEGSSPRTLSSNPPSPAPQRTWQVTPPPPSSRHGNPPPGPKSAPFVSPSAPTQPPRRVAASPPAPTVTPPPAPPPAPKVAAPNANARSAPNPNGRMATTAAPKKTADSEVTEEDVSWEKMVADTGRSTGKPDTDPTSEKKRASQRKSRTALAPQAQAGRIGWIIGISGVALLLVVGVGLWLAYFLGLLSGPATNTNPALPGQDVVTLSWKGPADAANWKEAFKKVRQGGTILIQDDDVTEPLQLGRQASFIPPVTGVTIQPAEGKKVRWRYLPNPQNPRLIWLYKVEDLTIRGLTLDGEGKVDEVIAVNHMCPDLTFDNLIIQGYKKCGLQIATASGDEGRPIQMQKITFGPAAKPAEGVPAGVGVMIIDGKTPFAGVVNGQYLAFSDCVFLGQPFEVISSKSLDKVSLVAGNVRKITGQPDVPVTSLPPSTQPK